MINAETILDEKEYCSTGELATICHVSKHTIITAIEKKDLKASRTPGGHNRIARADALDFMRKHNLLPEKASAKRILVVDDEDFIFGIMQHVFEEEGYEVYHAKCGYDAGKLAERLHPDVILLDIMLPDIDGKQVCRHIREESFGANCRIMAVTSIKDSEEVNEILEAGMDDYLAKPFTINILREKVQALLEPALK
ncbi:MAG: response regulator [Planctomycetota bacterium]|jgi:CheY-like chemotaxis protein